MILDGFRRKDETNARDKQFPGSEELITEILQNQFKYFASQKEMQRLILWELSAASPLMKSIHNTRETLFEEFLNMSDRHFQDSKVNFRDIARRNILYSSSYSLYYNDGTFAGMDLNAQNGKEDLLKAIGQIVHWAYQGG